MPRVKLELPEKFIFKTILAVRIDDINYGNHMSNDAYLKFMHEARLRFLAHFGYTEFDIEGVSMIMGDTAIVFKGESFYGDEITVEVTAGDFGTKSFDLYYRFSNTKTNQIVCEAKTGMVCFNYTSRKSVNVPDKFIVKLQLNSR